MERPIYRRSGGLSCFLATIYQTFPVLHLDYNDIRSVDITIVCVGCKYTLYVEDEDEIISKNVEAFKGNEKLSKIFFIENRKNSYR